MKKNKILIFIVIVTAIVAVIRTVSAQNRVKQLKREEYGGSNREYSLVMEKDGRDCEVNLTVNPKIPDETELNKMFEDIYENILTKIMGGNNSLSEVTENLDFTYNTVNLYETVKKIAAIRSVGNFACIMTDHEKRKQAEELAEITFGWTNVRPLIAAMKYVYLYMWSYAEGLADVKALLSGYKTGLIKTKDKWQVSYTDFLTLNLEIDEDAYKSGLSYEMYLRALLMLKDKTIKSSRTMDLVELWEKANGNKDFSIRNYIYGISGKILYTVKGLNKEYIYSFGQTY